MKPVQIPSFMSVATTGIELRELKEKKEEEEEEEEKEHGQNGKNMLI